MTTTPLKYLSVARFAGAEAGDFLQAQLSADIAALEPGDSTFACYCNPRGQVIGLLLVCRRKSDFLVVGAAELLPQVLTRLKMFVFRSKTEFALEPAIRVAGNDSPGGELAVDSFQPGGSALRYQLLENAARDETDAVSFKAEELRNGVSWLGAATTEKFIPQMLGFDQVGAVSFSKGCYPGQEIVARTRYLGKVKRRPVLIESRDFLPIAPAERVELRTGDEWLQGTLVDSAGLAGSGTLLFVIAPVTAAGAVSELRYAEKSYRCATI